MCGLPKGGEQVSSFVLRIGAMCGQIECGPICMYHAPNDN